MSHSTLPVPLATDALSSPSPATGSATPDATGVLAMTMALLPALGIPGEWVLQDTLKSALLAFGVLLSALVLVWRRRSTKAPWHWHVVLWLPLVLLLHALGSMVWSHTYLAGVEAVRWAITGLLIWLCLNTLSPAQLPWLLWGIHAGTLVASVWVLMQYWSNIHLFMQGPAPAATFFNRNFFAEYAVTALPLSLYLLLQATPGRWRWTMAPTVATIMTAILMTGTRSALASLLAVLLASMAILLKMHKQAGQLQTWPAQQRWGIPALIALTLAIAASIPCGNTQLIRERGGASVLDYSAARTASTATREEFTVGSAAVRLSLWKSTWRMVADHPWTGVGAGAWEIYIPLYQPQTTLLETDYYPHNEFLQLLGDYGLIVGALVLSFSGAGWLHTWGKTWRQQDTVAEGTALRLWVLVSLLSLMVVSFAGFPLHLAGCTALLAINVGILAATGGNTRLTHLPGTRQSSTLLGVGLALAVALTTAAVQAERHIIQGLVLAAHLVKQPTPQDPVWKEDKARMLAHIREGIAWNPHYRKLTPMAAEVLMALGDWEGAGWILESAVASRPHVAAMWTGLALSYSQRQHYDKAQQALAQVQRLRPQALSTRNLEIVLLSQAGHDAEAVQRLRAQFQVGEIDYDMVQAGYAQGLKTGDTALAIEALHLRNRYWPEQAADGYFRMGKVYAESTPPLPELALQAFRQGLSHVPQTEQTNYQSQVPLPYRDQM